MNGKTKTETPPHLFRAMWHLSRPRRASRFPVSAFHHWCQSGRSWHLLSVSSHSLAMNGDTANMVGGHESPYVVSFFTGPPPKENGGFPLSFLLKLTKKGVPQKNDRSMFMMSTKVSSLREAPPKPRGDSTIFSCPQQQHMCFVFARCICSGAI